MGRGTKEESGRVSYKKQRSCVVLMFLERTEKWTGSKRIERAQKPLVLLLVFSLPGPCSSFPTFHFLLSFICIGVVDEADRASTETHSS